MSSFTWAPTTFEDRLLYQYLCQNTGRLFLEVRVGGSNDKFKARRIDGVLLPDRESQVYPEGEYSRKEFSQAIEGKEVHLIEAKRTLNRSVIGQVKVGCSLLARDFEPAQINRVTLCSAGEKDLEWYCKENRINVALYPSLASSTDSNSQDRNGINIAREDLRQDPDKSRRNAFLSGWTDAVKGQLYKTVWEHKTHANMGNLFGWIYGDQDYEFRIDTWDRYVDNLMEPR